MQRIIVYLILAAVGWYGYNHYQSRVKALQALETKVQSSEPRATLVPAPTPTPAPAPKSETSTVLAFKCDGRIYCSQMTSCEEATFFLRNCPGTKMDGDNDGIPCESQWCGVRNRQRCRRCRRIMQSKRFKLVINQSVSFVSRVITFAGADGLVVS